MGGSHCALVNCGATNSKNSHSGFGLTFHKVPRAGVNANQDEWRRQMIREIRRADPDFKVDTASLCSRHFKTDSFIAHGRSRKLKCGSLPTENMPQRSIEADPCIPRKEPVIRAPPPLPVRVKYLNFQDVLKDVHKVKAPWSIIAKGEEEVIIVSMKKMNIETLVSVKNDLTVAVQHNGIPVAKQYNLEDTKMHAILENVQSLKYCDGVSEEKFQDLGPLPSDSNTSYYRHILYSHTNGEMMHSSMVRSKACLGIVKEDRDRNMCPQCHSVQQLLQRRHDRKSREDPLPAKAPLKFVYKERLTMALKRSRKQIRYLSTQKERIEKQLDVESVPVSDKTHNSLKEILSKQKIASPFLRLFWEQQSKAFSRAKGGMRWHPMLIQFAILIHAQSSSVYRLLRQTGCIELPGESTLREYTNAVHPHEGFNPEVIEEIKKASATLESNQRWIVVLQDEMAIKTDLVHDSTTGEVVGFVDSSQLKDNAPDDKDLATHVLVFMAVGVNSTFKMALGYFATRGATAHFIYPIFWKAVAILELECGLKVIATTCDKATPNQKFIRIHGDGEELCYKTPNPFADRDIYFVSDVPHLVKTTRNNLYASRAGGTRYLWNNGHYILWDHIATMYNADAANELYEIPLTDEHMYLTPKSTMRVDLAAQVLSGSVGRIMETFGGPEKSETAKFIQLFDRFFDCLNSRADTEGNEKNKHDLDVYRTVDDPRFQFLEEEFLGYLENWSNSVKARPGFNKAEKNMMFLSYQTYEGIQITVKSVTEATKFLLSNGVEFVRTIVFCQDPLEEHFGRHRALGRRSDNPTIWGFGYQENVLRLQRSIALQLRPRGNVRGKRIKEAIQVSDSPLKKRKVANA